MIQNQLANIDEQRSRPANTHLRSLALASLIGLLGFGNGNSTKPIQLVCTKLSLMKWLLIGAKA